MDFFARTHEKPKNFKKPPKTFKLKFISLHILIIYLIHRIPVTGCFHTKCFNLLCKITKNEPASEKDASPFVLVAIREVLNWIPGIVVYFILGQQCLWDFVAMGNL